MPEIRHHTGPAGFFTYVEYLSRFFIMDENYQMAGQLHTDNLSRARRQTKTGVMTVNQSAARRSKRDTDSFELAEAKSNAWIGNRVRELRKAQGLSIKELADAVDLSVGMVSQIERGLSTPSLRSLRLLAYVLKVQVSYFFATSEDGTTETDHILRQLQRRNLKVPDVGTVQECLAPQTLGTLEIYEIILEPGGSSDLVSFSHEGEKAGLVISGALSLVLGSDTHFLKEGDGFRFPSTLPHKFGNPGKTPVRLIWIVSTPKEQTPALAERLFGSPATKQRSSARRQT